MQEIILLISVLLIIGCSSKQEDQYDLIISNVNLIDGTGNELKKQVNVYVQNGRIAKIDSLELNQNKVRIDGTNKYLIPGFFDCHVHTNDHTYDFPRFIHFGVTSIFITGGRKCSYEHLESLRKLGKNDSLDAPRVFCTSPIFTMEGRHPVRFFPITGWQEGRTVFFLKDTLQIETLVNEAAGNSVQGIKLVIEDGPMPPPLPRVPQEFVNKIADEARKYNLKVFAHISDNTELKMALKAGISNFLHFTGVDLDFNKDDDLVDSIYQIGASWVTTLMLDKSSLYPLNPKWVEESEIIKTYSQSKIGNLSDQLNIELAKETLEYFHSEYGIENPNLEDIMSIQVDDIKQLYENVNMVLGTDTGNRFILPGHSLHEEMQLLEMGGMNPLDIIKMGTHNAAVMLEVIEDLGTIEEGKIADMIILNKNPLESISNTLAINSVIKNGIVKNRLQNDH